MKHLYTDWLHWKQSRKLLDRMARTLALFNAPEVE
jgi:hypothetical protein